MTRELVIQSYRWSVIEMALFASLYLLGWAEAVDVLLVATFSAGLSVWREVRWRKTLT